MVVEVARDLCWAVEKADDARWSRATLRAGRGRSRADRQDEREVAAARDEEAGIRITFHQAEGKNDGGSVAVFPKKVGISDALKVDGMDEMRFERDICLVLGEVCWVTTTE